MSEEVCQNPECGICHLCQGPHQTSQCDDLAAKLRASEEARERAEGECERLRDAWFVDEGIQSDGTLRPSLSVTLARLEKAERAGRELVAANTRHFDAAKAAEARAEKAEREREALREVLGQAYGWLGEQHDYKCRYDEAGKFNCLCGLLPVVERVATALGLRAALAGAPQEKK